MAIPHGGGAERGTAVCRKKNQTCELEARSVSFEVARFWTLRQRRPHAGKPRGVGRILLLEKCATSKSVSEVGFEERNRSDFFGPGRFLVFSNEV
jgi:hypothetical protein